MPITDLNGATAPSTYLSGATPMNKLISTSIASAFLLNTMQSFAHDPSLHQQNAQKPECASMKNMDMSKVDMNDPVMKAMHDKCMGAADHDGDDHHGSTDHSKAQTPAPVQVPSDKGTPKPDDHGGH